MFYEIWFDGNFHHAFNELKYNDVNVLPNKCDEKQQYTSFEEIGNIYLAVTCKIIQVDKIFLIVCPACEFHNMYFCQYHTCDSNMK